jgi:hypothetical protein
LQEQKIEEDKNTFGADFEDEDKNTFGADFEDLRDQRLGQYGGGGKAGYSLNNSLPETQWVLE